MVRVISMCLTEMDKDLEGRPPMLDQITAKPRIPRPNNPWGHAGRWFQSIRQQLGRQEYITQGLAYTSPDAVRSSQLWVGTKVIGWIGEMRFASENAHILKS
jgi:hypothetical protein